MCILDAHVLMRHHTPKSYFHSRSSSLHPSVLGPRAPMPPEVFQNHQRNNAPESSEHPSILFNGWWPKKTVKTLVAHTRAIGGPGIFLRSRAPFPPPHTSLSHASSRKLTHARTHARTHTLSLRRVLNCLFALAPRSLSRALSILLCASISRAHEPTGSPPSARRARFPRSALPTQGASSMGV
jgi:hypothetical protein